MNDPLRVCELITELVPAGAERCVLELATGLDRERFAVEVIALRGGEVADRLREAGIPVHLLELRGRLDLRAFRRLRSLLRAGRYDLLHTHLFHAGLAGWAALGRPRSGCPRQLHSIHIAEKRPLPWRFWWARLAARRIERFVCVSRGVRDFHSRRAGIDPGRYMVIHNGIDTARFQPDAEARARIRAELGLDDHTTLCLFVGRLDPQKGIATLLDGFSRAAARVGQAPDSVARPAADADDYTGRAPRLCLAMAGEGPLADEVRRAAAANPAIRPLGFRRDVPQVLAAADMLCMPSAWEGFGLAAAEAMACECPVIASRVEGLDEVVDPSCGIFIPPGSAEALADAIVELAGDAEQRKRLGLTGRRRTVEHFSLEQFLSSHGDLYREIAGRA